MTGRNKCSLFAFGKRAHFLCCREVNQMHATNHFGAVDKKKLQGGIMSVRGTSSLMF